MKAHCQFERKPYVSQNNIKNTQNKRNNVIAIIWGLFYNFTR
jgi:hypothetical protein